MSRTRASTAALPDPNRRLIVWLGVFTLLLSLFSPMIAIQTAEAQERLASLQGEPPNCEPGYVVSDDGLTCVEDPNAQLDQPDQQDPIQCPEGQVPDESGTMCVQDPNQQPPVQQSSVEIRKYECPEGDWSQPDYNMLSSNCGPSPNTYNMTVGGQTLPVTGSAVWGPFGPLEQPQNVGISEEPVQGYGAPHIFCDAYTPGVDGPSIGYVASSWQTGWDLNPGETLYCEIYNWQEGNQYGTVILHKFACQDDYSFSSDPPSAPIQELQQQCQQPMQGVTFSWEANGQQGSLPPTDGNGTTQWTEAPPGDYTWHEQLPGGYAYAVVHCSYHLPEQGNFAGQSSPAQMIDQDSFAWQGFEAGYILDCFIFNIPYPDIQIIKAWCEGIDLNDPNQTSHSYLWSNCRSAGPEVQYTLYREGQQVDSFTMPPAQQGGTSDEEIRSVESDWNYQLDEAIPQGYQPLVYCSVINLQNPGENPQLWNNPGEASISWYHGQQDKLICYWFNVQAEGYAAIQIEKYWCNEGYAPAEDAAQSDIMGSGECQAEGGQTTLSLEGPGGPYDDKPLPDNGSNVAQWELAEGGQYTVSEALPDGYRMVVYCHTAPLQANGENGQADPQRWEVMNGNQIQWQAEEGYYWICVIFNVYEAGGQHGVYVYKYACPEGMTPPESPDGILNNHECTNPDYLAEGVEYDLVYGGESHPQETGPEYASWNGVPGGQWEIHETIPDGYGDPYVSCFLEAQNDSPPVDLQGYPMVAQGGMISGEMPSDGEYVLYCYFYNFVEAGNSVTVYKWLCDPGTEYGQEMAYYQGEGDPGPCEQEHGGLPISLYDGHADSPRERTTDHNEATWDDVTTDENGNLRIAVSEPDGYGEPMVFCGTLDDETWTAYTATGGEITITPQGEQWDYQCNWYNLPEGEYNYLDLWKYYCEVAEAPPADADMTWYDDNCEAVPQWEFNLQWTGGDSTQATDDSGYTGWSGLPTGTWTLTEALPEFYETPVVWCRYVEWPQEAGVNGEWAMFEAPGGVYENGFGYEQMRMECRWYNIFIGGGYNYIDFIKYECPDDAPRDADKAYYEQNCAPAEGWEYDVQWAEGGSTETTNSNGEASWSGVPMGTWQATESLPEDYADPIVWCRYVEWPDEAGIDGQWARFEAPGGVYENGFGYEQMRIECHWYNFVPGFEAEGLPDYGWITIYKYNCAAQYESETDLGLLQEYCGDYTHDGIPFSLMPAEGGEAAMMPAVTSGGKAEWDGLGSDQYVISEKLPEGYATPKIWCAIVYQDGQDIPAEQRSWSTYDFLNGSINVDLPTSDARIICYWFNFQPEQSTVTLYKYDCDYQPEGFSTLGEWQDACPTEGNDHTFTLADSEGGSEEKTTAGGQASWSGVPEGDFTLTETLTPGWGEPVVWCGWTAYYEGAVYDAFPQKVDATGGVHYGEIPYPGTSYVCFWFNIPLEHSQITVYKYVCPEGYLEGVVPDPYMAYKDMCTEYGNGIEFTLDYEGYSSTKPITDGKATWYDVPSGSFSLTEAIPDGYDPPIWFCGPTGSISEVDAPEGTYSGSIEGTTRYVCYVFNFPDPDRTIIVYKYLCPEGYEGASYDEWSTNCTMPQSGVSFSVTDANGTWTQPTAGGMATWYGTSQGEITLDEHIPPGYFEPVIYCRLEAVNGAAFAEDWTAYPSTNGTISRTLDYSEYTWECHVFDIPKGPGEITIYKWLCPPGYDLYGPGANPSADCTTPMNGVTFTLDQPVGPNLMTDTGDSIDGAVYFGGLESGNYVVSETVPSDIEKVFILDCVGTDIPKVHPYPLHWGSTLNVPVANGDQIVCHWYNIPRPDNGWVTVYKYQCWTATFTSKVNCEIYEHGASFHLRGVPSNTSYGTGTTNTSGVYTWNDLPTGSYKLTEYSMTPCKVTATRTDGSGNARVIAGEGTIIKVYNCKAPSTTPTPPGKVPGKYPNTGVDPNAAQDFAPAPAALQGDGESTPVNDAPVDDYYKISCLDEPLEPLGSPTPDATEESDLPQAVSTEVAEEEFEIIVEQEDIAAEDADTTEATPDAEEECHRGALPERLVIDAANVDAGFETLEIIDGLMEQPTGPELVTWYKETGRLGEQNNVVVAGHLNYWNVPEGVFFYLDQLQEGDRIEVTGDDGRIYVYEVEWVRQESNLEPPGADVIGPTDTPSLTLITCGGEWNYDIAEYDERTVARAVQVDVIEPTAFGDTSAAIQMLAA